MPTACAPAARCEDVRTFNGPVAGGAGGRMKSETWRRKQMSRNNKATYICLKLPTKIKCYRKKKRKRTREFGREAGISGEGAGQPRSDLPAGKQTRSRTALRCSPAWPHSAQENKVLWSVLNEFPKTEGQMAGSVNRGSGLLTQTRPQQHRPQSCLLTPRNVRHFCGVGLARAAWLSG